MYRRLRGRQICRLKVIRVRSTSRGHHPNQVDQALSHLARRPLRDKGDGLVDGNIAKINRWNVDTFSTRLSNPGPFLRGAQWLAGNFAPWILRIDRQQRFEKRFRHGIIARLKSAHGLGLNLVLLAEKRGSRQEQHGHEPLHGTHSTWRRRGLQSGAT